MILIRIIEKNEDGKERTSWEQNVNLTTQEVVEWIKGKEGEKNNRAKGLLSCREHLQKSMFVN